MRGQAGNGPCVSASRHLKSVGKRYTVHIWKGGIIHRDSKTTCLILCRTSFDDMFVCKKLFSRLALLLPLLGFQGIVTNLAVALRYGWWGTLTAKPDHPISCSGEAWLLWLSGGAFFACAFLRVYRNHKVLVRHNSAMWPVPLQLSCMVLPFLLPPAILTAHPSLSAFEEDTQECERRSDPPEAFALGVLVVLVAGTVALTYNLREVRFQVCETFASDKG